MALCDTCQTVSFTALPRLPGERRGTTRLADNTECPQIIFQAGDHIGSPHAELPDPIGVPFHEDLDALAVSAQSCPVCNIAQAGVQGWIDRWEDAATNNTSFIEFHLKDDPIPKGQRLWLTACDDGEQGFCIWAKNPARSKFLYLLAVVRIYVGPASPLAGQFLVRPLELESASDASLDFVASSLQKCMSEHATGRCCSQGSTALPTRVLDIGSQGNVVKLVDGTHQTGKYASLSYCWGKSPPYLTSQENMEARRAGIDIRETPQTFKDAVVITRRLGLRYLWIDSLCICQDDAGDWARESSRMVDVYSNADVVIAANRSNDCEGGIFHTRAVRPSTVFKLPGGEDELHAMLLFPSDQAMGWSATEFPNEPLTKRAWALQERVLGKRVIHYNDRQIYFECDQGIFAEDGSHRQDRHCRLNDVLFSSHESPTSSDSLSDYKADLRLWYGLIRAYGRRELSKATDKMPAISGLARLFHRRLGGDYVAGLWSKAMIEGLAWQGLGDGAPVCRDQYIGPSWSWIGYAGIGATGLRPGWVDVAEVLDWHVDLKHEANPYGEVKDAWLRIRGPAIQLRHSTTESNEFEVSLGRAGLRPLPRVCTPHSQSEEGGVMKTDDEEITTTSEWKDWQIEVLILGGYKKDRCQESQSEEDDAGQAMRSFYGLVVRNTGDEGQKMQRIGWMFLDGEEGSKIQEDEQNWKTVTLV